MTSNVTSTISNGWTITVGTNQAVGFILQPLNPSPLANLSVTVGNSTAGNLILATNNSHTPVTNCGVFWFSNYDLYLVTPTKTNLIAPGH